MGAVTRMSGEAPVVSKGAVMAQPVTADSLRASFLMIRECWLRPMTRLWMTRISPRLTWQVPGRTLRRRASCRGRAGRWRRARRGGFPCAGRGRRRRPCCRPGRRPWQRRGCAPRAGMLPFVYPYDPCCQAAGVPAARELLVDPGSVPILVPLPLDRLAALARFVAVPTGDDCDGTLRV